MSGALLATIILLQAVEAVMWARASLLRHRAEARERALSQRVRGFTAALYRQAKPGGPTMQLLEAFGFESPQRTDGAPALQTARTGGEEPGS
jgi:hypothetical protein